MISLLPCFIIPQVVQFMKGTFEEMYADLVAGDAFLVRQFNVLKTDCLQNGL